MKQKILLTILTTFFAFTSCEQPTQKDEDSALEHSTEQIIHSIKKGDVEILNIDGCQYIIYKEAEGANLAFGYMSHKGNCSNPIHCYQTLENDSNFPADTTDVGMD